MSESAGRPRLRFYLVANALLVGLPLAGFFVSSWFSAKKAAAEACFTKPLREFEGHRYAVWSVAISPDGKRAVSGGGDETISVWDLESGKELRKLAGHTDGVRSVAISPDGKRAVSGGDDKTVRVWNLKSGKERMKLTGHTYAVSSVAISPDGKRVVSGSHDKTILIWDLESG